MFGRKYVHVLRKEVHVFGKVFSTKLKNGGRCKPKCGRYFPDLPHFVTYYMYDVYMTIAVDVVDAVDVFEFQNWRSIRNIA